MVVVIDDFKLFCIKKFDYNAITYFKQNVFLSVLKFGQRPYQYFADAYIMANSDWFRKLPSDLQQVVLDAGKKFGDVSTSKIIGVGEEVISEFEARGGKMTVLAGAEKDKFDKLMSEKVLPAMMDKFDADALKAAEAFVAN